LLHSYSVSAENGIKLLFVTEEFQKMNNLILIIDDDAIVREALKGILAQDIYRLEMETNGRRGLEKALTLSPDLILLDVVMPEMNSK
jgi:CheY-like chemotaxis protein